MKWIAVPILLALITRAHAGDEPADRIDLKTYQWAMARLRAKTEARAQSPTTTEAEIQPQAAPETGKRVIFVIDVTGTMMNKIDDVRTKVYAGVAELPSGDQFNIITESDSQPVAFRNKSMPVSPESIAAAWAFLQRTVAHGDGDFAAAIAKAIGQHPTFIWLVSDGDIPSPVTLARTIRDTNTTRVPINTVLHFADSGETQWVLWRISHDSGGICLDKNGKRVLHRVGPDLDKPESEPPTHPNQDPPSPTPSIFHER